MHAPQPTSVHALSPQALRIHAALPQTQCQRCGYPDCAGYAHAIAHEAAPINQCPPGGAEGIARIAALVTQPTQALQPVATSASTTAPLSPAPLSPAPLSPAPLSPAPLSPAPLSPAPLSPAPLSPAPLSPAPLSPAFLNPEFGREQERTIAFIDEDWCIGCTLCIKACPVDAIIGSNKFMHTVIEPLCTGCELCIPACPVDCIELEIATPGRTGWQAWTAPEAAQALERYEFHSFHRNKVAGLQAKKHEKTLQGKLTNLPAHSRITNPVVLDKKRGFIEAALQKARNKSHLR